MEVLRPLYLAVVRLYPEYWVQTCLQEKKNIFFLWFTWAENKKKKKSWRNRCATWNIHYYGDGHKENTCSSEGQLWIMNKYTEKNGTRCRLENRGGSPASTAGRLQPRWQNQNQTTISGKLNEFMRIIAKQTTAKVDVFSALIKRTWAIGCLQKTFCPTSTFCTHEV